MPRYKLAKPGGITLLIGILAFINGIEEKKPDYIIGGIALLALGVLILMIKW
jgi:hydrogenase-4 membrane subunit HyfE